MHDLTNAEPVYNGIILIGYVLKVNEEMWLPLDTKGVNYTGPSYKKDAQDIVRQFSKQK